ncbi:MAG: AAA family ATPase [Desulfobulbaceae bacterium]|nr:AAA family ATPase [Desulfobulbaceae bacterium]
MKLLKFSIRNYRSCVLTTLEPNSGLTALIGVNGSGKTNLLNALLLLKRATIGGRLRYPLESDYVNRSLVDAVIDYQGASIALRGEIFYTTSNKNNDEVVGTRLKWNLEEITGKKGWIELPIEMLMQGEEYRYIISAGNKKLSYAQMARGGWFEHREMKSLLPDKVFPVAIEISQYLAGLNYYSASQFSDPSRCPVSLELEDNRPRTRRRRGTINHSQFMHDLYHSYTTSTNSFLRFKNVIGPEGIGLISDIQFDEIRLPSNIVEVRAGGKTEKKERTQTVIVPTFTIDGNTLSPNQLSEGTFKTLALLYYVLTDDSQLLLVEEPEVCIHHGLLNSIIALIRDESRSKQIIISTHSDYVLDQLQPENVVLVDRKPDKGTKSRAISKAMSKTDFKALKQYLADSGNLGEYWREGGLADE